MSSTREQVLSAVKALVVAAVPYADVERNRDKPKAVKAGGFVNVLDGVMDETGADLSPVRYSFDHTIDLEFLAGPWGDAGQLQDMLTAFGEAVQADPYLGDLVDYLRVGAPETLYADVAGAPVSNAARVPLIASYSTSNPLL